MAEPTVIAPDPSEPTPVSTTVTPAIPQIVPQASTVTPSIPSSMVLGGVGGDNVSPAIRAVQNNLLKAFGMGEEPRDPMTGALAAPLSPFAEMVQKYYPQSRPLPTLMPEYNGGYDPLPPSAADPITVHLTSISNTARTGLAESPLGSLLRIDQMRKALAMHPEPGYDFYTDRQIHDAGYGNQMYLFVGSQSRDMTTWMIDRYRQKAADAEYIERMGPAGAIAKFAGGILGDPTTYLPVTLSIKSAQIAERIAQGVASAAETRLVSRASSVLWGTVGDSLANMSVQAGTHVMARLAQHYVNPTSGLDDVLDSLFVPTALAGSLQFVSSAFSRWTGEGLEKLVRQPSFLRGHAPTGARYVPDDFVGPVIHPTDEAASALASRYDRASQRMEAVDLGLGVQRPSLAGDSDYAAGKFGKQSEVPYNGLPRDGNFPPHSLATNYGPTRIREAMTDAATAAIVAQHGVETADFLAFTKGNKLFEMKGGPFQAYHGTLHSFDEFRSEMLGSTTGTTSARLGHFFAGQPETANAFAGKLGPASEALGVPHAPGSNVRPTYLRMTKPLVIENTKTADEMTDFGKQIAAAKAAGHDGVIIRNSFETGLKDDVYVVFDPASQIRGLHQRYDVTGPGEGPGSAGAQLSPQSQVYRREVLLAQGHMAPTGIGLEHVPLDPVGRTFQGLSVAAMQLVSDLVSTGGRLTVGNLVGKVMGTRAPVEMLIQANWDKPVIDLVRSQHDAWHEYRMALARAGGQTGIPPIDYANRTNMNRLAYEVGDALKGMFNRGDPGISFNEFRLRVAKALNNGPADELTDAATPFVNRVAGEQHAFYNRTRDLAVEHGVFDEAYQKGKDLAQSEVVALKKEADEVARRSRLEGWSADRTRAAEEALIARTEDAQFRLRQREEQLDDLRKNGPTLNGTARSYRPRLWDVGELTRLEHEFVPEIADWLQMKSGGTLDTAEAVRQAKEIHGLVSKQNPVYDRGDAEALFKSVASPDSAMARSLTIPDKMIEKYLVNDSETLLRYHAKQMGTAIEMKQRFGSLDLKDQIAEIEQEYRGLMKRSADETASPPGDLYKAQFEKAEGVPWAPLPPVEDLQKMSDGAIEDMQVLRDRLYGTHGAAADPHAWTSRTVRMAKQFANITLLGMSGVSSLGDFVRPLMTEGLDAMYGAGLRTLMSDARGTILNLARKDMELAGTGMDLMNNVRALQAADTGDVFGSRGRLEHFLGQANEWMFVANGLNQLTEWSKRWSSVMIQGRMNAALEEFAHTGKVSDPIDLARMAAHNIDHDMARRIGQQLEYHGAQFDNIKLANLGQWDDEVAAELYKSALNQSINRTVVTPGLGDRSNWMSTELGGLVSQYKAWGVANLVRSLQSGLQEGGNQFWYGAAGAVGFAILLNEVRSRLFYDHSTFDRPATAVIADGVDRSSILGWFSDANRAIETLTGNRLGFKPLMGAVKPHPVDAPNAVGTVLGPAAGQATRAASVLNDFIQGHPTAKTYNNWRTLIPGNTLPYLDPVFDHTISDGNFRKSMARSAEKTQQLTRGAEPAPQPGGGG